MERILEKKVIVITGGARGIGFSLCKGCSKQGATIIMCDIDKQKLDDAVNSLRKERLDCHSICLDVTNEEMIQEAFKKINSKYGKIDGLVNNAGIISKVSFLDSASSDFDKIINVNLRSVYLCCKEASYYMVKQKKGSIVNIS